jgi:hypothetical protein
MPPTLLSDEPRLNFRARAERRTASSTSERELSRSQPRAAAAPARHPTEIPRPPAAPPQPGSRPPPALALATHERWLRMNVPTNIGVAQRRYPRVCCGEEGCGRQLASNHPKTRPCPFCDGMRRRYELGLAESLTVKGELQTLRKLTRFNSDWFVVQLFSSSREPQTSPPSRLSPTSSSAPSSPS